MKEVVYIQLYRRDADLQSFSRWKQMKSSSPVSLAVVCRMHLHGEIFSKFAGVCLIAAWACMV